MKLNAPNTITIFRMVLVPFFIWQFIDQHYISAAVIYIIAWLSDFLDGYIARKYNLITDFGKIADPLADKMMTLSALFLMGAAGWLPLGYFLPIIMLAKELTLVVGGAVLMKRMRIAVGAKWIGKIATFLFTISIMLLLFEATRAFAGYLLCIAVLVTFVALAVYTVNFFRTININKVKETTK